jgi:hypothetical protein
MKSEEENYILRIFITCTFSVVEFVTCVKFKCDVLKQVRHCALLYKNVVC